MSAPVTREHRRIAATLIVVPRVQPSCIEQWIDGMALPAWAEKPFAEVVVAALALAEAEAGGRAAERADVVRRLDNELADDEQGESWMLMERTDFQDLRTSIARGDHVGSATVHADSGSSSDEPGR